MNMRRKNKMKCILAIITVISISGCGANKDPAFKDHKVHTMTMNSTGAQFAVQWTGTFNVIHRLPDNKKMTCK